MHTQNPIPNQSRNGQTVKTINKTLPQFDIKSSLNLAEKAIHARNGSALVISPEKIDMVWVFYLQAK